MENNTNSVGSEYMQQGDVLLRINQIIPTNAKEVKPDNGRLILASGIHTGHAHVINLSASPESKLLTTEVNPFTNESENLFLLVEKTVKLTHEEHEAIEVKPGIYRVGKVREVDPYTDEIRSVQD